MGGSGFDTRWWNFSVGIVASTAMCACGPTTLDQNDSSTTGETSPTNPASGGADTTTTPSPAPECTADDQCPPGDECIDGMCIYPWDECASGGYQDDCGSDSVGYYDDGFIPECQDNYDCGFREVCVDYSCDSVEPLLDCDDLEFTELPLPDPINEDAIISLSFIDADGDGMGDLLVGRTSIAELYLGADQDTVVQVDLPPGDIIHDSVAGDFNGDRNEDLAYVTGAGRLVILSGDGTGQFSVEHTLDDGVELIELVALDWDDDGALDLAGRTELGTLALHLGDGAGALVASYEFPDLDGHRSLVAGDASGDLRDDLITHNGRETLVFAGNGSGDVELDDTLQPDAGSDMSRRLLASTDTPLAFDDFIGYTTEFEGWVLIETWQDFGEHYENAALQEQFDQATLGDWDGNGVSDLIFIRGNRMSVVYRDVGTWIFFSCQGAATLGAAFDLMAAGDFNGDGQAEVAMTVGSDVYMLSPL